MTESELVLLADELDAGETELQEMRKEEEAEYVPHIRRWSVESAWPTYQGVRDTRSL